MASYLRSALTDKCPLLSFSLPLVYSICSQSSSSRTTCCFHKQKYLFNCPKISSVLCGPVLSGGDDRPTLSWLPLHPHWVLDLPPAVRIASGCVWGGPPSRSPHCCFNLPSENQGGAERRRPQEEGQESRVGHRAAPVKLHLTHPYGLNMMGLPIPSKGKGQFDADVWWDPFYQRKMVLSTFLHSTRTLDTLWCSTSNVSRQLEPIYSCACEHLHLCSTPCCDPRS